MRQALMLLTLLLCVATPLRAQGLEPEDSLRALMKHQLDRLSSPELEARKARRRWFQQRGYTHVLSEVVRHDGLGAVISYLRLVARLELALPDSRLFLYVPVQQPRERRSGLPGFTGRPSGPMAVPLREDRGFPVDPWQRERP